MPELGSQPSPQTQDSRPEAAPALDELQRGQEEPVTLEQLEPPTAPLQEPHRTVAVPDPGERPGALTAGKDEG